MRFVLNDVVETGGLTSGEHGIGRLRRGKLALYKDEASIDLIRAIKATLDRSSILDRGKVI